MNMTFGLQQFTHPEKWDNWFITVKNRHNGVLFPIEVIKHEELESTDINREHWKIYISMHLPTGEVYQTSSIESFNEVAMEVTTKNGSNYKLENPLNLNEVLVSLLKKYFTEE